MSASASAGASGAASKGPGRSALVRGVILGVFLLAVVILWVTLPVPTVDEIREAVGTVGWWSGIGFILGYGVLSLIPIPKSVVSIAAGLIWGFWLGVLLVTLASVLGATLAFLIGRGLGRDLFERFLGKQLRKVDEALTDNGLRAVIVLRLIPVLPFTLVNYCAGLTSVRRRDYALGTVIGMLPGTVVFVAVGAYGLLLGLPFFITVGAFALAGFVVFVLVRRSRASSGRATGSATSAEAGAIG